MTRLVLVLSGVGFGLFGVLALIDPIGLWQSFGLAVSDTPAVRTELRAFYGGLELALGALLLVHLGPPARERTGLVIALFVYLGLGLGRVAGMIVDGEIERIHLIAAGVELGLATLAAIALARHRS